MVLAANPHYRHGAPGVQRVILRHVPEPSVQRRLLESGDIDLARDLTPDLIAALAGNAEVAVDSHPRGTVIYLAANAGHPILGNDQVVQALRHAVDYRGMADSFLAGQFVVHQAFWPRGLWAAYTETPYRLDIARARSLLAQAGHGDGFAGSRVRGSPRHAHQPAVPGDRAGGSGDPRRRRDRSPRDDLGGRGTLAPATGRASTN